MIGIGRGHAVRVPDDIALDGRTLSVPGTLEKYKFSIHQGSALFHIEGSQIVGDPGPGTFKLTIRAASVGGHYFAKRVVVCND